ncbi:hypothetical protein B0H13DRAFT_2361309 [Mycena leptocephala]|nr:hypothetical protein B0H13DRAFT_2361309 [Mycena leptocephala]
MLSTSRASPAFISLLKTLNINIFTHIWICHWNPNAFAHDIHVSVACPAPSPFCDECGFLSESRDFGAFPSPLPCSLSTVHFPFHPPLPSYLCPLHSTPACNRVLISVPARACTVPHLKRQERVSPHPERAAPPRRRVPNDPAHNPPALALPATYVPSLPTVTVSCATLPRRSKLLPAVYPQRTTRAPKCMRSACIPGPCEHHRSGPAELLDLCAWAIPLRPLPPPVSTAPADSVPLAHVAFSASHDCDPSISIDAHTAHAPGPTTPAGCSGRGTRFSSHTPPPSPQEIIHLRGEPMHARSKLPRSSATGRHAARETRTRCIALSLAARRSSGRLARMHTRTWVRRNMERVLRDPSGGDVFVPTLVSLSSFLLRVSALDVV